MLIGWDGIGLGDEPGVGEVGGEVDGYCAAEEGGICECHIECVWCGGLCYWDCML
jgi:hypothetical protein